MRPVPFRVRDAVPADVLSLMRLKRALAESEDSVHVVRANADDWLRDGFGPRRGFISFVAEAGDDVIGMATCSERTITGWVGPIVFLQDLFVDPDRREHGVAHALMARVAAFARELGSPIVELTVRTDNDPAQRFYRRTGFRHLPHCLTYVLGGPALAELAEQDRQRFARAG
jgi:ribosomal protein S18 acetylase RimI-like enzyme